MRRVAKRPSNDEESGDTLQQIPPTVAIFRCLLQMRDSMLRNYLTIAIRNLRRHAGYTFINVLGLSVGIACCLLVFLYIRYEYSFDAYHEKGDRVYRVISYRGFAEKAWAAWVFGDPLATLRDTDTDVEDVVRVLGGSSRTIVHEGEAYSGIRTVFSESSLFNILSLGLTEGDVRTVLERPQTAVVTKSLARRFFQDRDPVGQFIPLRLGPRSDVLSFEITGVMRDVPVNSHLQFDLLLSWESLGCPDCGKTVYVLLKPGAEPGAVAERALSLILDRRRKNDVEVDDVRLEPLRDIHFSYVDGEGDIRYVYLLTAIAMLIMLIACVNYMNLATARSIGRAREVGVRKAMGAHPFQIIRQFLAETLVLTALALPVAILLLVTAIPTFNELANTGVDLDLSANLDLVGALITVLILVGLLAGSYPALFLSRFRPTEVLTGRARGRLSGLVLRRALIVFQFVASVVLIVVTIVVLRQLKYMQNRNLGFDAEQVITVKMTDQDLRLHPERILELFRRQSGVLAASALQGAPGEESFAGGSYASKPFGANEAAVQFVVTPIDTAFLATFNIPLVEGRNISNVANIVSEDEAGMRRLTESPAEALINETGVRAMRWDSPSEALGKVISASRVVGVVADFNFESLHSEVQPVLMSQNIFGPSPAIAIRLAPGDIQSTISDLQQSWKVTGTMMPFEFRFLSDELNELYIREQRTAKVFGTFAGLAIFISCLGLLGLAAFTAAQRTKEIGIRKVLGATVSNIVSLLTTEFLTLIVVAIIVAVPIAYIVARHWLQDFAYRIQLDPDLFIVAGLITILIAIATTGFQAVRAASADPVESLRWE